ncbi:hypothetical protein [Streptacidiphilus anmyonensis]|uniref:hypothetical protein n=1 Tax=Streptacidiphilus anmyonensis TaxID=405782 RepID=UPI000ACC31F2|nr:hypothetical protein [Streptacidiphilus anmyonensis]
MTQSVITTPVEQTETWDPLWVLPQVREAEDEDDAEPNLHAGCRVAAQFLM